MYIKRTTCTTDCPRERLLLQSPSRSYKQEGPSITEGRKHHVRFSHRHAHAHAHAHLKVERRASLASCGTASLLLSLKTTSAQNHRLATLSSKSPRENGNSLTATCRARYSNRYTVDRRSHTSQIADQRPQTKDHRPQTKNTRGKGTRVLPCGGTTQARCFTSTTLACPSEDRHPPPSATLGKTQNGPHMAPKVSTTTKPRPTTRRATHAQRARGMPLVLDSRPAAAGKQSDIQPHQGRS